MISIGTKAEFAFTHQASEIMRNDVSWHRRVEHILQGTTGADEKKRPLIHDLDQLTDDV